MKIRTLSKHDVEKNPYLVWNAFVDLVAMERYEDLTEEQRFAHLVFWYDSEAYNGGHTQYFENRKAKHLSETIAALGILGANCQQQVLRDAADVYFSRRRTPIQTIEEYSNIALEGEFSDLDSRLYACSPTLFECLKAYLEAHQSSFVSLT
jgi:hypothetical protein